MATTKDVLIFTDPQGIRRHVKDLDARRARRYADALGSGASCFSQLCFRPDGSTETTEKELLAFLRQSYRG